MKKAFGDLGYRKGDLPVGEYLSERTFALPMFPEMTEEEFISNRLFAEKRKTGFIYEGI